MADEPIQTPAAPAEPVDTLDRVLTELNKTEPEPTPAAAEPAAPAAEPAKPAEPKPGDPPKPEEPKPGEPPAAAEPFKVGEEARFKISDKAVETRADIEKLPYANDATFKKIMGEFADLSQFKVGMGEALNAVESVGKWQIKDADTMKAVVRDAYNLYDVITLQASPIDLLELAAKNYGEENITQVIAQILQYAKEKGITAEQYTDITKPENKKIFELGKEARIRREREATQQTERQQAEETKRKEQDFADLETFVGKWAKDNKVDEADTLDYLTFLVAQIGGDQKQLEALRAGKFGGFEKILTEYNNRMVERQARWEKSLTDGKQKRDTKLQGAAAPAGGGTPPAEVPKKKININDDDERMGAVKAALRE